jgi:hypothetical protein
MSDSFDLLTRLDEDLTDARAEAALWLNQSEARQELLNRAELVAAERGQFTLSPQEMVDHQKTERERVEVLALMTRAYAHDVQNATQQH